MSTTQPHDPALAAQWYRAAKPDSGPECLASLAENPGVGHHDFGPLVRANHATALRQWKALRPQASGLALNPQGVPWLLDAMTLAPAALDVLSPWDDPVAWRNQEGQGVGHLWLLRDDPRLLQGAGDLLSCLTPLPRELWQQPDAQGRWPMEAWLDHWHTTWAHLPVAAVHETRWRTWRRATLAVVAGAHWRSERVDPAWVESARLHWDTMGPSSLRQQALQAWQRAHLASTWPDVTQPIQNKARL